MDEFDKPKEPAEQPRPKREPEAAPQGPWDDAYKWLVLAVALGPLVSAGAFAVKGKWDERSKAAPAERTNGAFEMAAGGNEESTYVDVVPAGVSLVEAYGAAGVPVVRNNAAPGPARPPPRRSVKTRPRQVR